VSIFAGFSTGLLFSSNSSELSPTMASTWHCLPILLLKLEKIKLLSSESSNPVFHVSVDLSEISSRQIVRSSSWTPASKFSVASSSSAIFSFLYFSWVYLAGRAFRIFHCC
jgi:hypothetical protein